MRPLPVPSEKRTAPYPYIVIKDALSFTVLSKAPEAAKASPFSRKQHDSALLAALHVEASLRHHAQRSNTNWERLGVPAESFAGIDVDIQRALAGMAAHPVGLQHVQAHLRQKVSLLGLLL